MNQMFTLNAHQRPTVGDTKISVVGLDHMGWLLCDGRNLSVNNYTFLFNVIGYQFGGSNGQFALPSPAGRVPGIVGSGSGLTTRTMGSNVGEETHTLVIAEMPSHNHGTNASNTVVGNNLTGVAGSHAHTLADPGHAHSYTNQANSVNVNNLTTQIDVADNNNVGQTTGSSTTGITVNSNGDHQHSIATQGGDAPHNNMQPTLFIGNMFIYSGKAMMGKFPYTAGYYASPPVNTISNNIL